MRWHFGIANNTHRSNPIVGIRLADSNLGRLMYVQRKIVNFGHATLILTRFLFSGKAFYRLGKKKEALLLFEEGLKYSHDLQVTFKFS